MQELFSFKREKKSTCVVALYGFSFPNIYELKDQLLYSILMADGPLSAIIVHKESCQFHSVTRFVTPANFHTLIRAVGNKMLFWDTLNGSRMNDVDNKAIFDCRTMYDVITKNSNTAEICIPSDIVGPRESSHLKALKRTG